MCVCVLKFDLLKKKELLNWPFRPKSTGAICKKKRKNKKGEKKWSAVISFRIDCAVRRVMQRWRAGYSVGVGGEEGDDRKLTK